MCDKCGNKGQWLEKNPDDTVVIVYCDCPTGLSVKYGLDPMYLPWTFDTYPGNKELLDTAKKWLDGNKWLWVEGAFGTGKTGIVVALYKAYIDRLIEEYGTTAYATAKVRMDNGDWVTCRPAQFWRFADLSDADKKTWNTDITSPLEFAMRCRFLVLDDLGAERQSEFNADMAQQLLSRRYTKERRTVITTNWDKKTLTEALGERVYERINHLSDRISIVGKSLRKAENKVQVFQV